MNNPLTADLDLILDHTRPLWEEVRGRRIFITGGTGFFGCWLLESFAWANERLGLRAQAMVLTRNPEAFDRKAPHLVARPDILLHHGDVRDFVFPSGGFSHLIHAATEASTRLNEEAPERMLDTIVAGTRRALEFGVHCGAEKFLLTSSGAVYGAQPPALPNVPEAYNGGPDVCDVRSAYAEGKRLSELLCAIQARGGKLEAKIARCFAFVGPYLPLDAHFAIGNFIGDAMAGGPVKVNGDGTPYRSYLYAADLAIWLWTILFRGASNRPYNVGSGKAISIAETAQTVASTLGNVPVTIAKQAVPGQAPSRYVPDVTRATTELALRELTELPAAIKRTAQWQAPRHNSSNR